MHRIDDPSAVPTLPAPKQPGAPGFFTSGSPTTGLEATIVSDDWANATQEELCYVIEQSGLTLSKTDRTQLFQALARLTRLRLTANMTFYVSPTGSDANDGLTTGTAWVSIAHAYNYIRDRIDTNGFQTTIKLADGTYGGTTLQFPIIGPQPILLGDDADPSRVIINNSTGVALAATSGANISCQSFTVQAGGPAGDYGAVGSGLLAGSGASIVITNMRFGACSYAHMDSRAGGVISAGRVGQNYTIAGAAQYHLLAGAGFISVADCTVSIAGNPAFSQAFAAAIQAGLIHGWSNTYTGTATGKRYHADTNGIILVAGGGINYFPGSVAGDVASGGYYG